MKLRFPWSRTESDPYWERFIHHAPADPANLPTEAIRKAPEGSVFAVKADVHTPEIMASHLKELGRFFGATAVGVVRLRPNDDGYPLAVVCGMRADHDPAKTAGFGGQWPTLYGSYVTFNLGGAIREYGFRATRRGTVGAAALAAAARLGTPQGAALVRAPDGTLLAIADVIWTDIPLAADGEDPA